jgi:hypothetical protein
MMDGTMRTAPASFLLSAIALTTWLALGGGCGGKVSVDGDAPDPSGTTATGMGGSTATATNVVATTDVTAVAVGVGGAPNGSVGSSMADGPPPPPDGPSVGSGASPCDFTGDCQACSQCAFDVACADEAQQCNSQCADYSDCVNDCDPNANGCFMKCNQAFPEGHVRYANLVACLVCSGGACVNDCAEFTYLCGK